jgi:hypothetical protein
MNSLTIGDETLKLTTGNEATVCWLSVLGGGRMRYGGWRLLLVVVFVDSSGAQPLYSFHAYSGLV